MQAKRVSNRAFGAWAGLVGLGVVVVPVSAGGQTWTATRLHDAGLMRQSYAYSSEGRQVGGEASINGTFRPILWDADTGDWSELTPPGFIGGQIRAVRAGRQAGAVATTQTAHAALWSGTAASFVDLHPVTNPYISEIQGMDATEQVGYVRLTVASPANHAALWRGTAGSFVSLHRAGAYDSEAPAAAAGQQGGFFRQTEASASHAALWSGAAQSMMDLHPTGAIESQIVAMAPGQQVGWSRAPVTRAAMWHGTAQSYIDMGPPGSGFSIINSTCGSAQAGFANFAGSISAVVWFGSPTDFVRLDAFMPQGYWQSIATGISEADGLFYVSGYARNTSTNLDEAFVWVGVPSPGALGTLLLAGIFSTLRPRRVLIC